VQLTLGLADETVYNTVSQALGALQWQSVPEPQGVCIDVSYNHQQWQLFDHSNQQQWQLKALGDLIYHLSDRVVFHIADQADAAYCLHAAAVTYQNKAIVIPAQSGSGKSSFTCWLVKNGFDYITDELVLVQDDGKMQGIARPIQIKAHGLKAVEPLIVEPKHVYYGERINALAPSSLGATIASEQDVDLGMLLFPQYLPETEFVFQPLSRAEAGMQLMSNYVNARNHAEHGFRQVMDLVRTVPAYTLNYAGFGQLPNDFAAHIQQQLMT